MFPCNTYQVADKGYVFCPRGIRKSLPHDSRYSPVLCCRSPPLHRARPQAFKISISVDSNHAESHCNLATLEVHKQVRSSRATHISEPVILPLTEAPSDSLALLSLAFFPLQPWRPIVPRNAKRSVRAGSEMSRCLALGHNDDDDAESTHEYTVAFNICW